MRTLSSLIALCVLAGCPPDLTEPPPGKTSFACEVGVHEGQPWAPIDGGNAEMTAGFQGFLFIPFRVRATAPPDVVEAQMNLDVQQLGSMDADQPQIAFTCGPNQCLTPDVMLFLDSGTIESYVGRRATMTVRLESADQYCITSARVTLVDDECDPNMQDCG